MADTYYAYAQKKIKVKRKPFTWKDAVTGKTYKVGKKDIPKYSLVRFFLGKLAAKTPKLAIKKARKLWPDSRGNIDLILMDFVANAKQGTMTAPPYKPRKRKRKK